MYTIQIVYQEIVLFCLFFKFKYRYYSILVILVSCIQYDDLIFLYLTMCSPHNHLSSCKLIKILLAIFPFTFFTHSSPLSTSLFQFHQLSLYRYFLWNKDLKSHLPKHMECASSYPPKALKIINFETVVWN